MWDLTVSVPDHCLSLYFELGGVCTISSRKNGVPYEVPQYSYTNLYTENRICFLYKL